MTVQDFTPLVTNKTMTNFNDSNSPPRVVVAMSGGVDSSVAAALLKEQGYDVIGMMMRLWSEEGQAANRCCTPEQMADARRIADQLGIPFYVIDVKDYFRKTIVQFFINEHEAGRTPNPCIECNRQIRFTFLYEHALALDADYLATGHYARVRQTPEGYQLLKGLDERKDQSYVLHMLTQEHLAHVKFPIGEYEKTAVRELAKKFNLPVASKQDSQDLCFLGDGDYRRFLTEYSEKIKQSGPILDQEGNVLGQHNGLAFYTIGQRKGLGISAPQPLFVVRKDATNNALIVAPRSQLGQTKLMARDVSWIMPQTEALEVSVKIRYKATPIPATVHPLPEQQAEVTFHEPVFGITPGQGAVFYDGMVCLGGGLIADSKQNSALIRPTLSLNDIEVIS